MAKGQEQGEYHLIIMSCLSDRRPQVAQFSLEEKVNVTTGIGWGGGRCVVRLYIKPTHLDSDQSVLQGNISPIREWPGLCLQVCTSTYFSNFQHSHRLQDSPLGVRFVDFVTAFPAPINAAASFNRRLIRLRGLYMGREHVGKGVNIALGPMMNMGRVAEGGRNWEGFGADPFLAGEAAYETILGMQQGGVVACAKHLVAK
jgi:beta-glucosidase